MDKELLELLKIYPINTACIKYLENGLEKYWYIGAVKNLDNENTLKTHLKRFKKNAKMLCWAIK